MKWFARQLRANSWTLAYDTSAALISKRSGMLGKP